MDEKDCQYAAKLSEQIYKLIARAPASQETLTQELEVGHPDLAAEVEKLPTLVWYSLRSRLGNALAMKNSKKTNKTNKKKKQQERKVLACTESWLDHAIKPSSPLENREDILKLITEYPYDNKTYFGDISEHWDKKRVNVEVKMMSEASIRLLLSNLKAAATTKGKEERLSTQLVNTLTKKYECSKILG